MDFVGIEKLSLVDFDNNLSVVLFCESCNFRCPFCHNSSLVLRKNEKIDFNDILEYLKERKKLLDGVVISGGEPTLMNDLAYKCKQIKDLGYLVKLDTNGTNHKVIKYLIDNELIYGLGVSLVSANESFINEISKYPNAVIHVINGVHAVGELEKLYDKGLKLLILGYKEFRRGKDYYSPEVIKEKNELYNNLENLVKHFKVVSFDNLALKQLNPKRLLTEEEYDRYYMGADGQSTMFVDLVKEEFSTSSTTPEDKRHRLLNNINDMFKVIRKENK